MAQLTAEQAKDAHYIISFAVDNNEGGVRAAMKAKGVNPDSLKSTDALKAYLWKSYDSGYNVEQFIDVPYIAAKQNYTGAGDTQLQKGFSWGSIGTVLGTLGAGFLGGLLGANAQQPTPPSPPNPTGTNDFKLFALGDELNSSYFFGIPLGKGTTGTVIFWAMALLLIALVIYILKITFLKKK